MSLQVCTKYDAIYGFANNDRKCLSIESYKQKQCDSIGFTNKSKESVMRPVEYWTNDSYESVLLMNSSKENAYWTESIRVNQQWMQWTALKLSLFSVKQVLHQYQYCLYRFVVKDEHLLIFNSTTALVTYSLDNIASYFVFFSETKIVEQNRNVVHLWATYSMSRWCLVSEWITNRFKEMIQWVFTWTLLCDYNEILAILRLKLYLM